MLLKLIMIIAGVKSLLVVAEHETLARYASAELPNVIQNWIRILNLVVHFYLKLLYHGDIILNRSNNSMFLRLKTYWNWQAFDLILASGIWMKHETLRHQASSLKFHFQYFKILIFL